MKKPCNNCPFRKDSLEGWLGEYRARQIAQSATSDNNFYCHKTLIRDDEGDTQIGINSQICAGSVLLHQKEGRPNCYYRFIDKEYSGSELIFDSANDFIEHHS
ncbi:DUF6283 family protein [Spirosoma litoris]